MASIARLEQATTLVSPVETRLLGMLEAAVGKQWAEQWSIGLPDPFGQVDGKPGGRILANNPEMVNYNLVLWLWTITKAWGLMSYGRDRYKNLIGNLKQWDVTAGPQVVVPGAAEEPLTFPPPSSHPQQANLAKQMMNAGPGLPPQNLIPATTTAAAAAATSDSDDARLLARLKTFSMPFPAEQVLAVLKESVEWFAPDSTVPLPPFAYDMQPDRPWPERNGPTNFTEQAAKEKEAKEAKEAKEKAEGSYGEKGAPPKK